MPEPYTPHILGRVDRTVARSLGTNGQQIAKLEATKDYGVHMRLLHF